MYMIQEGPFKGLIAKSGNRSGAGGATAAPGVVTTTGPAAADVLHTIPIGRSFYVRKILWYQATGLTLTLLIGTLSNAGIPALIQVFPTFAATNLIHGGVAEEDLPLYEFMVNSVPLVGWDGSLYVTSSVAGVLISVEVAEKA